MSIQKYKKLDTRFSIILTSIVEGYINTCSPISSKFVQNNISIRISSATIRNVMSNLEKDGFLKQVHKSGGRIPTDLAYRFYINTINVASPSFIDKIPNLEDELKTISSNVDELLNATALMVSKLSNMFGVVTITDYHSSILKDIELVELNDCRVMLVLATENGLVKSIVLDLEIKIATKYIDSVTYLLKDRLIGLSLNDIQNTMTDRLNDASIFNHELVQILVNERFSYFSISNNKLIYTSPINVLLEQPEFQNITNLQQILPALEKTYLNGYLNNHFDTSSDYDLIGRENKDKMFKDCAILTSKFQSNAMSGRIGIIGPKRLNYINVKNILNTFKKVVQDAI